MSVELVVVAVGGAIALVGVIGWLLSRRRQRAVLVQALRSSDPATRRAAAAITVEQGLANRFADLLSRAAEDPEVSAALLGAFRAAPWHAAGGPGATRLRLQVERPDARPVGEDPERLARPPIIVTGAGGAAGVAVIQALRSSRRVIGVDADPAAAGLSLADTSAVLPRGDDPGFVPALVALSRSTGATTVVCTVAEEMVALRDGMAALDAVGLRTWLAPRASITDCIDKWAFAQRCEKAGLPVPRTMLGEAGDVPGPWIVKPRFGRGSRDIVAAFTRDEVDAALKHVPDPIVQTALTGREFTVDALVETGGRLVAAVPRWRVETKGGISTKGLTFADDGLIKDLVALVKVFALEGAVNVQGFIDDDGRIGFTEINPRFSGGLPLSLAAGADLVGEYVHRVEGGELRADRLQARPGVAMARYFSEVFVP